ncbi:3D (Asp-Asp-Asp) domain-containing protein [Paenibacillus sp. 1_12]|nr:3D (Asp-Asp-Asp) domain-containing protein [Paenibacillus sp. 1_12]
MNNEITKRSLVILILSGTLIITGAKQAGEAKIDTLKHPTVTMSVMSETKIENMEVSEPEVPLVTSSETETKVDKKGSKVITMNVSEYSNHEHSTGKTPRSKNYGITASGSRTEEGRTIAADWKVLPKGTKVYIEGIGERVVEDKGGAIKGNKIDVFFESEKEALNFGRQQLNVTIID